MQKKKNWSPFILILLWIIGALMVIWYIVLWWYTRIISGQTQRLEEEVLQKQDAIVDFHKIPGYTKFVWVEQMQSERPEMYWSDYIVQVIDILEDLKNIDTEDSQTIVLSDFQVSLEEITLKWQTSTLKALYYNSASWKFISLIDRFEQLDFIENMQIREYEKNSDWLYEFEIIANVNSNPNK